MKKRGLSNIIITIFLVVIALILVVSLNSIMKKQDIEKSQLMLNCIQDIDVKILNACYKNNLLNIQVKNRKDIILGDFFLIQMIFDNESKIIPTAYKTSVMPYQTKTITIPYYEGLKKIKVIPRIESQNFLCMENAIEFSPIGECENE